MFEQCFTEVKKGNNTYNWQENTLFETENNMKP